MSAPPDPAPEAGAAQLRELTTLALAVADL